MTRQRLVGLAAGSILMVAGLAGPAGSLAAPRRHASATHRTHTISFYARVVHSGPKGLLVRTRQGKKIFFSATQLAHRARPAKSHHRNGAHHRRHVTRRHHRALAGRHNGRLDTTPTSPTPTVSVNIVGLQPGVTVQITETTDSSGVTTITITLPPASTLTGQTASGVITEVDSDAFMLHTLGGSDLRLNMAPDALSGLNLQVCNTADVTYHQDANLLIADTVSVTGTSTTGDCAADQSGDVTGTITAVSSSGVTITADHGGGPMTFVVDDSDITNGFAVGDYVDVSYFTNDAGNLDAGDVEYVELQTTGVVTAVSSSGMTITDDTSGQPDTFTTGGASQDDQGQGLFDGVAVGDQVGVSYHISAGQWVADSVDDNSGDNGGDGSDGGDGGGD